MQVTAGAGLVCLAVKVPQAIRTGDVVWIQLNERHWRGASETTSMTHIATSLGTTSWQEEVSADHYPGTKRDEPRRYAKRRMATRGPSLSAR